MNYNQYPAPPTEFNRVTQQPAGVAKLVQVPSELDSLEKTIQATVAQWQNLCNKLSPVMRDAVPQPADPKKEGMALVPVAERIRRAQSQLADLVQAIAEASERLEV